MNPDMQTEKAPVLDSLMGDIERLCANSIEIASRSATKADSLMGNPACCEETCSPAPTPADLVSRMRSVRDTLSRSLNDIDGNLSRIEY